MSEIDMFADLELTLLEVIDNRNASLKPDCKPEDINTNCLEDVKNLNRIHGPAVRAYNLYKATRAFKDKRYLDSVYCETFALSLWMRIKYHANKIMEDKYTTPNEGNLAATLEEKREEEPRFIEYLDRFIKNLIIDEQPPVNIKSIEFENGTELMNLCFEFPKEWTVIQLCKQINLKIFLQSRQEALRFPRLIFMTLFCYPMSERFNHQPIKIVLNQTDLNDLYETCHAFSTRMSDTNYHNNYEYFRKISDRQFNTEIVDKMKKLLGPWIVLFSGKSKTAQDQKYDDQIIAKVDRFLQKSPYKYSPVQNVLICLIARRLFLLSDNDIEEGALYISKTEEEWFELLDFFYDHQLKSKPVTDCYPVILVVDEQIDFFYWEMCNPKQEFTRVDSMVTLLKLYYQHKENISNGYYIVKQQKASAVLNPDLTLPGFKTYIQPLLEKYTDTPGTLLLEEIPTFDKLRTMLVNSDIYVYCGHGSGLQYITSYETSQLVTSAVVFLMGCSSIAFDATDGYALGSATHQYYHIAKSPAIIGHLNLAYLNYASLELNLLLAKWLGQLKNIDSKRFGTLPEDVQFAERLQKCLQSTTASPYLTKVISMLKQSDYAPISFRAILCYRGLPVHRVKM